MLKVEHVTPSLPLVCLTVTVSQSALLRQLVTPSEFLRAKNLFATCMAVPALGSPKYEEEEPEVHPSS